MPGTITSPVEVVQLTPYGLWIAYDEHEYFLDHDLFPWFKESSAREVFNVEEVAPGHFRWPDLDVDMDLDRIEHPELYPLVAKRKGKPAS